MSKEHLVLEGRRYFIESHSGIIEIYGDKLGLDYLQKRKSSIMAAEYVDKKSGSLSFKKIDHLFYACLFIVMKLDNIKIRQLDFCEVCPDICVANLRKWVQRIKAELDMSEYWARFPIEKTSLL